MITNRGPFRRKGVEEYSSRMSRPREKPVYDSTVTTLLNKAGYDIPEAPASIYDPPQLYRALEAFGSDSVYSEDEFIVKAVKRAYRAFGWRKGFEKLKPVHDVSKIHDHLDLTTSAGVFFRKKEECWEEGVKRFNLVKLNKLAPYPCLAGARTQRENKTRLVWGYPLDMIIMECQYSIPLIDTFKLIRSPIPYALRRHELGARLDYTLDRRLKVALDFSKFDTCVPPELIHQAFRILKTWFDFSDEDSEQWKKIREYFIKTPIVMPDGNLYTGKKKGVPSGSGFTQLIDSIVNYIIITAAMLKFGYHPHEKKIHILGDDSVFSTDCDVDLRKLQSYFDTLGFKLNVNKSQVVQRHDPVHFIGFDWLNGVPNRDIDKTLLSLTQPERWRERCKERRKEFERALRLILEASTLGVNLYEVINNVFPTRPSQHIHLVPESKGLTGYMQYQLKYDTGRPEYWRNMATGVFI